MATRAAEGSGDGWGECANCRVALHGKHCHECGQAAHVHRSLGGIGHELAHGVFHFEGKIWRTLPLLFFEPGALTRRYVHGERARFVSPLALFLFAVFLTFAVFEFLGPPNEMKDPVKLDTGAPLVEMRADLAKLQQQRAAAQAAGASTAKLNGKIAELKQDITDLSSFNDLKQGKATNVEVIKLEGVGKEIKDQLVKAARNPELLTYKLQNSAYKFAWALIVLSLPFMWLAFAWRRDIHLYDHAVFVTYSLSFVMLAVIAGVLVSTLFHVGLLWLAFAFPLHLFVQLRGAYRLGWWGAGWRTPYLSLAAVLVLAIFTVLLVILGVVA